MPPPSGDATLAEILGDAVTEELGVEAMETDRMVVRRN